MNDSEHENDMKTLLRTGGAASLNVYSVGFVLLPFFRVFFLDLESSFRDGEGAGLLGYSTFPWDYNDKTFLDGVVVLYSSLPGGTLAPYNKGRTLTHEIGHWLGLYHTFQVSLMLGRFRFNLAIIYPTGSQQII